MDFPESRIDVMEFVYDLKQHQYEKLGEQYLNWQGKVLFLYDMFGVNAIHRLDNS